MPSPCLTCEFFNVLYREKNTLGVSLFNAFADVLLPIFWSVAVAYILWSVGSGILKDELGERLKRLPAFLVGLAFVTTIYQSTDEGDAPFLHNWVFYPIEHLAGSWGLGVMEIADREDRSGITSRSAASLAQQRPDLFQVSGNAANPDAAASINPFAVLAFSIEVQVLGIVELAATIMSQGLFSLLAGLILMLPYLFVIGVFAAFLVEAMFKFLGVALVAPILVPMLAFPATRSFSLVIRRQARARGSSVS